MVRVIDQPLLKELGRKYGKSAVQIVLAWGVNNGRSVIPKSTIDWQIQDNVEADFKLDAEDMKAIETSGRWTSRRDSTTAVWITSGGSTATWMALRALWTVEHTD